MKKFSKAWKSSTQARKQRKYRAQAPLHVKQKLMSAHLEKTLRKEYKARSIPIRKGDEVVVLRGQFRKMRGAIKDVDLKGGKILVDGVKRKKVSGQEIEVPIDPSNVMVTKINLDDKKRRKFLDTRKVKVGGKL